MPAITLRVDELPTLPEVVKDVALITIFVDKEESLLDDERGTCVIRVHHDLHGLIPLSPRYGAWFDSVRLVWREAWDYPQRGHLKASLETSYFESLTSHLGSLRDKVPNHPGMKVGGWPHLIQETRFLMEGPPDFVLQIDSSDVYSYCDAGIGYLMRSPTSWWTHWETM